MMTRTFALLLSMLPTVGIAHAQKLQHTNPSGLSKSPVYSQVVRAGKLVFVAGQLGGRPDGTIVGPGMKEQFEQALSNLAVALKSQGADFNHIAKITIFVTNMREFQSDEVVAVRGKHFGNTRPASTLVQVAGLANSGYKVEIDAIAVLP